MTKAKTIKCTICQKEVPTADYAQHVQKEHAAPTSTTPSPRTTTANFFDQSRAPMSQISEVSGPLRADDYAGIPYLKGSDVPADQSIVTFKIIRFVNIPGGRSKLAAEINETFGKKYFGMNVTNVQTLRQMGYEDLQTLIGRTITCVVGFQPNPQRGGELARSLFISNVE